MNIKTFIHNFTHDQYKYGFYKNGVQQKKYKNAYYKSILNIINSILIYLFGLFTPEIKRIILSLFK